MFFEDRGPIIKIFNIPQTELAMRGSYGVAFRRGYDSSPGPVVLPVVVLYCNLHDLVTPTSKTPRKVNK